MADRPKHPSENEKTENEFRGPGIGRRKFVKLVGGTGMAVTAGGVIAGAAVLPAIAADAPAVMGPTAIPITLRVNGEARKLMLEPRVTLLDALRNHLDLTGAKKVCDRGTCGACTVQIERAGGVFVHGARGRRGRDAARNMAHHRGPGAGRAIPPAFGCVCRERRDSSAASARPGFVMASKAFLDRQSAPVVSRTRKQGLGGGNFCRCGTYRGCASRRGCRRAGAEAIPANEGDSTDG